MKFLPVIDIWNPAVDSALRSGQLKLQCGQWVTCGGREKHRFVGATRHSLIVAHPKGARPVSRVDFKSLREYYSTFNK